MAVALLALAAGLGCFRSLPPPTIRQVPLAASESYEKICADGLKRAELASHDDSKVNGFLECKPHEAAIVLFNSFKLRVRTITISRDGEVRDEISYLSPNRDSVEDLLDEISSAIAPPGLAPSAQENSGLTVQIRERRAR